MTPQNPPPAAIDPFEHLGLFYRGGDEYLAAMVPFIQAGLAAGEPVLVAVPGSNLALIQDAMGADADHVRFQDMTVAGRNPGRIIPTILLAFVAKHPTSRVRIIGEPIWAGRTAAEYPACVQHEALINLALAGHPATVLCPYDAERLPPGALADAEGTHPALVAGGVTTPCAGYVDPREMVEAFNQPLPEPTASTATLRFDATNLPAVRMLVADHAAAASVDADRARELQYAVNELATNSVEHAGGDGRLRVWSEPEWLVCEIQDTGHLTDPLVGRRPATAGTGRGRGLLLIHALCDLVTIHTRPASTTIRLQIRIAT